MNDNCEAYQMNDQMMCGKCGLQWDVNDPDPPECKPVERGKPEFQDALRKLKSMKILAIDPMSNRLDFTLIEDGNVILTGSTPNHDFQMLVGSLSIDPANVVIDSGYLTSCVYSTCVKNGYTPAKGFNDNTTGEMVNQVFHYEGSHCISDDDCEHLAKQFYKFVK